MKCPLCKDGHLEPTGQTADGYPMEKCSRCNVGALLAVEGREPPIKRVLRALHEVGCEPGRVEYPRCEPR